MATVTTQAFDKFKSYIANELSSIRSDFVKLPEFLTYRRNLEDEQANYRMTADADIKSVIQGIKGQFTIESQQANEKMEIIANESRARDEVIGSSMAANSVTKLARRKNS